MTRLRAALLAPLIALLLAVSTAGCGGESASPPETSSSTPTDPTDAPGSDAPAEDELVAILTGTSAGGEVDPVAATLGTPDEVAAFVAKVPRGELPDKIRTWVAQTDVPPGRQLMGAVVAVGCQVPTDVEVTRTDRGVLVEGVLAGKSPVECFAAMTSVALVLVTP